MLCYILMMRDAAPPVGNIMKLVFTSHNIGWKERKSKKNGSQQKSEIRELLVSQKRYLWIQTIQI